MFNRFNQRVGISLTVFIVLLAVIGSLYTPYDPVAQNLAEILQPPSASHWFGTDQYGRDVFSRALSSAGDSLMISVLSVAIATGLGSVTGAVCGFFGNWVDRLVMMLMDAYMAFPSLLLALAITTMIGPRRYGVVIALGLTYLPTVVRVVRSVVLSLREKEFVEASYALGNTSAYTIFRHILPNCIGPVLMIASSLMATALLTESALSFLGLGIPPPAATWGGMLAESKLFVGTAIWLAVFPGLAIIITLLGFNLLGDALRDRFDPRMNL